MEFGLSFLPDASEDVRPAAEYYSTALELCVLADNAGFTSVKMTEHYLHPYGGYCPSPLMFLAAVASVTKRIRLMTGCILPVFHHPIQIAAESAMLDAISNGRVDVGFARAYLPYEFEAFHIDMDKSRDRYVETILATLKLWKEKNVSINTPYFSFERANSMPDTIQKPHPPVWGAAVYTHESFEWLGSQGFNLLLTPPMGPPEDLIQRINLYKDSFVSSTPHKKPLIAMSLPIFLHEDHQIAVNISEKYLQHYLDVWADAASIWSTRFSKDYVGYSGMGYMLRAMTPAAMRSNLRALVGTPKEVVLQLEKISKTFNIHYFLLQIETGCQPREVSFHTLDLFIRKVMPELREAVPTKPILSTL